MKKFSKAKIHYSKPERRVLHRNDRRAAKESIRKELNR
jgi:hypothetical protein